VELLVKSFEQILSEGLYDPNIFKAFFLAGGPGSGKSFVARNVFTGTGLKLVNSDIVLENSLKKAGLSLSMPDEEQYFRDILRTRAKAIVDNQIDLYVKGRLGLVIDATGRDYNVISRQFSALQLLGYDCYMVFVNTSLEVALERNAKRERVVPEYITKNSWQSVQNNIGRFQNLFGLTNFVVVDNSKSEQELVTLTMNKVNAVVRRFLTTPIKSYIAKRWMAKERMARRKDV
jgi:cytidylate kinase